MMNLSARMPSVVSSSTSSSPGKRCYGNQDPWRSVVADDRSGQPDKPSSAGYSKLDYDLTFLGLLKSGKVRLRHTIDQGNLIKLLVVRYNKFILIMETLFSTEVRNP